MVSKKDPNGLYNLETTTNLNTEIKLTSFHKEYNLMPSIIIKSIIKLLNLGRYYCNSNIVEQQTIINNKKLIIMNHLYNIKQLNYKHVQDVTNLQFKHVSIGILTPYTDIIVIRWCAN